MHLLLSRLIRKSWLMEKRGIGNKTQFLGCTRAQFSFSWMRLIPEYLISWMRLKTWSQLISFYPNPKQISFLRAQINCTFLLKLGWIELSSNVFEIIFPAWLMLRNVDCRPPLETEALDFKTDKAFSGGGESPTIELKVEMRKVWSRKTARKNRFSSQISLQHKTVQNFQTWKWC